jgi:translation initiation factor 2D
LKPVSIVIKLRQGRKACTLITNFEAFLLDATVLADELQKLCASSTTGTFLLYSWLFCVSLNDQRLNLVTPLPAKNSGFEVMVQGSQIAMVTKHLMSKGVPKEWIESADMTKKKK